MENSVGKPSALQVNKVFADVERQRDQDQKRADEERRKETIANANLDTTIDGLNDRLAELQSEKIARYVKWGAVGLVAGIAGFALFSGGKHDRVS